MRVWIIAGVALVALLIVAGSIGLATSTSGPVATAVRPITVSDEILHATPYPSGYASPTFLPEDCRASSTCNAAAAAAISAYSSRTAPTPFVGPTLISAEYVEWPDSCLGVQQADILCLQVITPGFRIILRAADTPFVEYHTDLNGTAVYVAEYDVLTG